MRQQGFCCFILFIFLGLSRDGALCVRLFNANGDGAARDLHIGFKAGKVEVVELDGRVIEKLNPVVNEAGQRTIRLRIPRFGIRTLRFSDVNSFRPD